MKVQVLRRTAAYIASCVLLVTTVVAGTGCVSSAPLASKNPMTAIKAPDEPFVFELQPVPNSSTIQLILQKPVGKRIWITFKDPQGEPIERFCTEKKGRGIYRNYNFTEANEGVYSFQITDGKETVTKTVKLESTVQAPVQRLTIE